MRSPTPFGRTLDFVEKVRAVHGAAYVRSWLQLTCQFDERVVWTWNYGADRLRRECGKLAEEAGVFIRTDQAAQDYFMANTQTFADQQALAGPKPKRKAAA